MSTGGYCVSTGIYSDGKPTCYCQIGGMSDFGQGYGYGVNGQGVYGTGVAGYPGYGVNGMMGMRRIRPRLRQRRPIIG